jgi:hypothetical protein
MPASHKESIRQIGILLASTAAAHNAPSAEQGAAAHQSLRTCWSGLKQLAEQAQEDIEGGELARERLLAVHRAALDDLVEAGTLDAAVAEHVQSICDAATYHVWRLSVPLMCYAAGPPYYLPPQLDAAMLVLQADSLQEIAPGGEIAQETISRARAAIEQEMTHLARLGRLEAEGPQDVARATHFLSELLLVD